jgi:sugar phosphate isomerase/epimerase
MDRRRFVGTVGGALAAWPLGAACGAEPEPQPDRPPGLAAAPGATPDAAQGRPIGVQLYTVRRQLAEDFEGTLARVAEIGYREVEFAGYAGRTPRDVRRVLDAAGLVAPSAHVDFPAMAANWESTLAGAREIGHHYLTIPSIPRQDRTAEGYRRVAEQFNRFGERELDLFWVTRGGGDPLAYFAQWPGRFPMVHAKDMDGTPERGMTEVGSGIIPFPAIAARAEQAGIRHWFVEHDNPSAPLESIRRSFEGLRRVVPA